MAIQEVLTKRALCTNHHMERPPPSPKPLPGVTATKAQQHMVNLGTTLWPRHRKRKQEDIVFDFATLPFPKRRHIADKDTGCFTLYEEEE
jgi:hypothetical protein